MKNEDFFVLKESLRKRFVLCHKYNRLKKLNEHDLNAMNLDILTVHLQIINYLQNPKQDASERKKLEELKQQFMETKPRLSRNITEKLQKEIGNMESHFEQMDNFSLLNFYLLFSVPLMEKYKKVCTQRVQLHFMTREDDNMKRIQKEKEKMIQEYLFLTNQLFQNFHFLKDIIHDIHSYTENVQQSSKMCPTIPNTNLVCEQCKNATYFDIFDNQSVCRECGIVIDQFQNNILSFKDIERVNISSKYTYDRRTHFRDCFYQFQGKQNVTIPNSLYEGITQQLFSHGIIPENHQDLPKEMAFEKVEKEHITIFLKDSKFVKHYEDAVLIFHTLTGKAVPELSYLEEDLMNDFDVLVEQYDKKFKINTDRKNFINTQYVLFQLLRRHKYPCRKEDFNILKTIDRKYYHDEICSELFSDLGWNFQPLF